ncbi:Aldehyde dehydrogenase family [Musa troglodytarum]|uniref:Aldehyde dehydrogenase family n=1 Tax=Musa troglodytarum TaxID=320322 RepID=A0A9E7JCJ1_9LILI|nr:Aldehyde dehydrogenase family [Musa troglodytarum]
MRQGLPTQHIDGRISISSGREATTSGHVGRTDDFKLPRRLLKRGRRGRVWRASCYVLDDSVRARWRCSAWVPLAATFLLPSVGSVAGQPIPPSLDSLVATIFPLPFATTVDRLRKSGVLRAQGLVGGNWIDAYDGMTVQVHNPATGDVITSVACIGRDEATDAISSAYSTFTTWSKLTASDRSKCLRKW